jgi:lipoprotein-anchoring transpeptidase ErfK/SrfK
MPRYKATLALAFIGVLISAGTVGSQDPLKARAEAESAETAIPITAPADPSDPEFNPYIGRAEHAPQSIVPHGEPPAAVEPQPQVEAPVVAPQISLATEQKFALALATTASDASAHTVPTTPAPNLAVEPGVRAARAELPDQMMSADLVTTIGESPVSVAQRRLLGTVPDEIEPYFDLFMYVSKSNRGPLAQRMYVFQRDADGKIIPYAEWMVSTGREKIELHHERKIRTVTPEGIFALNPKRFHKRYWSTSWDGAPMHYAMFYDLMNNGNQSGLAIHAAIGADKIRKLGRRDSAGCVRLSPKNAKELFYKVRNTTQGRVPVLALNERGSTDRWGRVQYDDAGSMLLQDGYRALVFVENFDGRDELVSPVIAYTN